MIEFGSIAELGSAEHSHSDHHRPHLRMSTWLRLLLHLPQKRLRRGTGRERKGWTMGLWKHIYTSLS